MKAINLKVGYDNYRREISPFFIRSLVYKVAGPTQHIYYLV